MNENLDNYFLELISGMEKLNPEINSEQLVSISKMLSKTMDEKYNFEQVKKNKELEKEKEIKNNILQKINSLDSIAIF